MIRTLKNEWKETDSYDRLTFSLILLVSLVSVALAVFNYPVIGHDAYVHLNWLDQFARLRAQGLAYPRWLPDSFGGFGAPTFYFYPPLVYWSASLLNAAGVSSINFLYQSIQLGFAALSIITSFLLLREHSSSLLRALAGALLFSFVAYRFCDVYVRNALTEHAALAFLPLVFVSAGDRLRVITIRSIGWAGLFLTNLPSAYIAAIAVIILIVFRRSFADFTTQLAALVIGVLVSAAYLFPAFALRGLTHQRHLFDLPMHTSQFGFALLDLVQGRIDWLRILSVATIIAGAGSAINYFRRAADGSPERPAAWGWLLVVCLFFQLPFISKPFWHLIPGMPFVQFSWRWNGIMLIGVAILFVAKRQKAVNVVLIGLALITLLSELTISRNLFVRPPLPINAYRMDAPEYAPKWAANDPNEVIGITQRWMSTPAAVPLGLTMPGDSVGLLSRQSTEWTFAVHLSQETPVRFHQFYWPYWKAFTETTPLATAPDSNGIGMTVLPAGAYSMKLHLMKAPSEKLGRRVSYAGVAILTILLGSASYRSMRKRREAI